VHPALARARKNQRQRTRSATTSNLAPAYSLSDSVPASKLAFEMTTPDGAVTSFALTLANGHLTGEASAEFRGTKFKGVVDATREK